MAPGRDRVRFGADPHRHQGLSGALCGAALDNYLHAVYRLRLLREKDMHTYKIESAHSSQPSGLVGWSVTLFKDGSPVKQEAFFNDHDEDGDEAFEECVCVGETWWDDGDERQAPQAVVAGRWPWIFRVGNLYSAELLSHVAPHENGVIQPQPWEVLEPVLQAWTTEENRGWIAFNRESADLKYARFSTLPKWPAQRC